MCTYDFLVKIVGGKGYAFWGRQNNLYRSCAYLSLQIGANAFAYPFAYPKRMTDQGRYAKNSAFRQSLTS